ncbi:MAG: hypothetical protein ACOY90_10030 [Candidatus Zhuqueibacterota bacterium]
MSRLAGINDIRTSQKIHIRSISKRRRSKFLSLFMLDNERQLLQKDNQVLAQRHSRNAERIGAIDSEIAKSIENEFNSNENQPDLKKQTKVVKNRWQTREFKV